MNRSQPHPLHARTLDRRRRRPSAARAPRRRGVAMLLVLGVVVMASVLGYAMLSSAAITKAASNNAAVTASAQGMAESGINLAIYYLQNPDKAPTYPTTYPQTATYERAWEYWRGTSGQFVELGSPAVGSVKVDVRRVMESNRWQYEVESVGRSPGNSLERRVRATVFVNAEYRVEHAAVFNNDVTLTGNARIGQSGMNNGDTYSNGALAIRSGGQVLGRGTRRKITSTAVQPTSWQTPPPVVPKIVPTFDEIRSYQTYESPRGTQRAATILTGVTELGSSTVLEPSASNPAGVFYVPGSLTVHSGAEIRGTLIVQGNLNFAGALIGGETRLRSALPGFPALIVGGNVLFGSPLGIAPVTRIEGLTYVAGKIDGTGLLPTLDVRGALLVGGTSPIFITLPLAYLTVNYDQALAAVPDFSQIGATPISIKVLAWEAQ